MGNSLEVRGLEKRYGAFSLKNVSFDLPAGYIMGFVGPNGSGKTTTIKSLLGIINTPSGTVTMFGLDSKTHAAQINGQIGVVMDTPFNADDWTVTDVARAVAPFYSKWSATAYAGYLARFGIDKTKTVKELSRGMKVKLMMAVALSHEAKLLILDEPTSGLDPVARDELCDLLREFVTDESKSVLFSTHITSDLEKIADYITFILDGHIIFTGPKDDFLEKFVSVKGGLHEINSAQKSLIIGLREHGTGFEGIAHTSDIAKFPKGLLIEPVTLDEIIIYMNRGAQCHA